MEHDANVFIKVPTSESSDDSEIRKSRNLGVLIGGVLAVGAVSQTPQSFRKYFF